MEEIKEEVKTDVSVAEKSKAAIIKERVIKCVCEKKHIVATVLAVILLLAAGGFYYSKYVNKNVSPDVAKAKIQALIDEGGSDATIKSVVLEGDLYKISVEAGGQEQPVYVTRDGKNFIQSMISFEDIENQKKAEEEANKQQEITKSDKPIVDLYVMSFCPFGNKAEDTIKPVYELLKNKATFNFRYIVSSSGDTIQSLHGQPEVVQNEREACVMKNYGKDQWMNFATYVNKNCGSDGACWEAGAKSLKLDVAKINACVKSEGAALMKADEKLSSEAGASGSPTMFVNGVSVKAVYQYGNSEAYKQAICGAFNTAPEECAKALGAATETTAGGSCN